MLPTVITESDCQNEEQRSLFDVVSGVFEESGFFVLDEGSVGQARLLMIDDKHFWKSFGGVLRDTIDSSLLNLLTFYVKDAILLADRIGGDRSYTFWHVQSVVCWILLH